MPQLPVAVIGFCAGGQAQTRLNFEQLGFLHSRLHPRSPASGAGRSGRSGTNTEFIPAYDQKIPQLHTKKKKELGLRTARWALEDRLR